MKKHYFIIGIMILAVIAAVIFWFNQKIYIDPNLPQEAVERQLNRIKDSKAKIKENPEDYYNYFNIALSFDFLGDVKKAEKYYKKAGSKKPAESLIWHNLGVLYEGQKEYQRAEEMYQKARELNPGWVNPYFKLADLWNFHLTDRKGLITDLLTEGIERSNQHPDLIRKLAFHLREIGEYQSALDWWRKVLEVYPDDEVIQREITELEELIKK